MENQNQQTQTPQFPNQIPSANNSSSGSKTIPIAIGVIAVLIISIGAYIFGTKQNQPLVQNQQASIVSTIIPSPTPTPIAAPTIDPQLTTNWKTYINSKNKFSIDYPDDKQVIIDKKGFGTSTCYTTHKEGEGNILIYPKNYSIPTIEPDFSGDLSIIFFVIDNEKILSNEDWIKESCIDLWNKSKDRKQIDTDGIKGLLLKPINVYGHQMILITQKNKKIYIVQGIGNNNETLNNIFLSMISTFKFTP